MPAINDAKQIKNGKYIRVTSKIISLSKCLSMISKIISRAISESCPIANINTAAKDVRKKNSDNSDIVK